MEKLIKQICQDYAVSLVGRTCKTVEILLDRKDLSERQKLELIKTLNKEAIYQETRNLDYSIKCAFKGLKSKSYKVYTPNTDK